MDYKQKINCTVKSCVYNNDNEDACSLKQILVAPCQNCSTGKASDESMCGSYEARK